MFLWLFFPELSLSPHVELSLSPHVKYECGEC